MTMHHEIIGYPIRQIHKLAMNTFGRKSSSRPPPKSAVLV